MDVVAGGGVVEEEGAAVEVRQEAYPRDRSPFSEPVHYPYPSLPEGISSRLAPLDPEVEKGTLFLLNNRSLDVKLVEAHALKCTALRKSPSIWV